MVRIIIEREIGAPENPREDWEQLGTMALFHNRYMISDKGHGYSTSDYNGWDEMKAAIERDNPGGVILPVYMYDHSGITLNTTGFSCPWDSGQVGFIFASAKKIRDEFGVKRISKKTRDRAIARLNGEVETYSHYLSGEVYCFRIEGGEYDGEACGSFYGPNPFTNGMSDNIPESLHDLLREAVDNM